MICYAKSFSIKSPWILEGLLIKKVHAVLIYILCQHKQPSCKHTAVSTMSNNSVSIRSPLSCVRGLHANRCPRLTLTSYSWLTAIKSINENINTNFSASLSPDVKAAQRHHFPSGLCEWTGCSEPARSGSPKFVYWTACAERDTHTEHGGCRGGDEPAGPPGSPSESALHPEPPASGDGSKKGRKYPLTGELTYGHANVRLRWSWTRSDSSCLSLGFAVTLLGVWFEQTLLAVTYAGVRAPCALET